MDYPIDYNYLVSVKNCMLQYGLEKPRRRNIIKNYDEILPIILVEAEN